MAKADRNRRWYARRAERARLEVLSTEELAAKLAVRAPVAADLGQRERLIAAVLELSHPTAVNRPARGAS